MLLEFSTMDITKRFYCSEDLLTYIHRFEKENFQLFQISDNKYFHPKNPITKYKYIVIKCIHHIAPDSAKLRTSSHYDPKGCPCFYRINFNTRHSYYEFTKCYPDHNHETTQELFDSYSRLRDLTRSERDRFANDIKSGIDLNNTLMNNTNDNSLITQTPPSLIKKSMTTPRPMTPKFKHEPIEMGEVIKRAPEPLIDRRKDALQIAHGLMQQLLKVSHNKETYEYRVRCVMSLNEIWENGNEAEVQIKNNDYDESHLWAQERTLIKNESAILHENLFCNKKRRKSAPKKIPTLSDEISGISSMRKRQLSVDSGSDESGKFSNKESNNESDLDTKSQNWSCPICKRDSSKDLIGCGSCSEWYHLNCLNLDVNSLSETIWFCQNCDY